MLKKIPVAALDFVGIVVALILLAAANWLGSSSAWLIALVLIAIDAIFVYFLSKKALDESYRRTLSVAEEFAKKKGFRKTAERGVLKFVWLKWNGYSLDTFRGSYKGREVQVGVVSLRKTPYPGLIIEDFPVFIETSLGEGERFMARQEYFMGSTGILGMSALCLVKGSEATPEEIDRAMASLIGSISL